MPHLDFALLRVQSAVHELALALLAGVDRPKLRELEARFDEAERAWREVVRTPSAKS